MRSSRNLTGLGGRLFALGLVLGLLATVVGSRELLVAGCFSVVLPIAALLLLPQPRLHADVDEAPRGRVGDAGPFRVVVRNTGRRTSPPLALRALRELMPTQEATLPSLAPGTDATWTASRVPVLRGTSHGLRLEISVTDVFGLAQQRQVLHAPSRVLVAPRRVVAPTVPEPLRAGAGTEPADLRPFRAGDPTGAIAWRASARRGAGPGSTLVTRTRRGEDADVLRLGVVGGMPDSEEATLEVVAAVGCAALATGRDLELHLGSDVRTFRSPELLLDALATVSGLPRTASSGCDVVVAGAGARPSAASAAQLLVRADGRVERS